MINELAGRIWAHAQFHAEAAGIRTVLLRSRYFNSPVVSNDASLRRLLRSALILAASSNHAHRHAAYEIATAACELNSERFPRVPLVLLSVLARVGNFPAMSFAKRRYSIEMAALPTREVAESEDREAGNSIYLGDSKVAFTDFQFLLWSKLIMGDSVGVSAPTSAGKSFVLQMYARKLLAEKLVDNVAIVVPTRALINQVSEEASRWLRASGLGVELVTTPVPRDTQLPVRATYILTQERLQLIQAAHPSAQFGLMLVDEAQSIADGARGVLLSSVIEEALLRNPTMQLLFAGPNIRDPGRIATLFGRAAVSVRTDEATVSQNIVFVDCDPENSRRASLSLRAGSAKLHLGSIECEQALTDHRSKLVNLALRLGASGQSLIYAMGPAECEEIAFGLADDDALDDVELGELSTFIKEAVHPKFQLANNVLHAVGFHYGRLPSLVRKAVEDAFGDGKLRFLVTTSTLLQGVNLPAQNLFLHNPQKGKNIPITPIDFWNLAGRAGRLGKEFSGNIFLVDYGSWETDPIVGSSDQFVKPSIESHVVDRIDELIAYIADPVRVPDRLKPDDLENTFVKLVKDQFDGKLLDTLDRVGLLLGNPKREHLLQALASAVSGTNISRETLVASPTVSLHRQQSLYNRLSVSLKKNGAAYIVPKHPLDVGAYNSFVAAMKRCHDEILKYPATDRSHRYYALIALRWIKGEPLPQIIDASISYRLKSGKKPNIGTVIRETLTEIENDLRFRYVRLFSCYNAVLEQVLLDNNRADLVGSIPSLPMYLEVGACSPTMISFMGLGLSRYTAGKLRALPRRTDMSQAEARAWILRHDIEMLNLPSASVKEVRRMVFEVNE